MSSNKRLESASIHISGHFYLSYFFVYEKNHGWSMSRLWEILAGAKVGLGEEIIEDKNLKDEIGSGYLLCNDQTQIEVRGGE